MHINITWSFNGVRLSKSKSSLYMCIAMLYELTVDVTIKHERWFGFY